MAQMDVTKKGWRKFVQIAALYAFVNTVLVGYGLYLIDWYMR